MRSTRRQFISQAAVGGMGVVSVPLWAHYASAAASMQPQFDTENIVPLASVQSRYDRFSLDGGGHLETVSWIEIDLNESRPIGAISVRIPARDDAASCSVDVCIECSESFADRERILIGRHSHDCDFGSVLRCRNVDRSRRARFVRVETSHRREGVVRRLRAPFSRPPSHVRADAFPCVDYIEIVSGTEFIHISPPGTFPKRPLFKRV